MSDLARSSPSGPATGGRVGAPGLLLGLALLTALVLPVLALALSATPQLLGAGLRDPHFVPALALSLRTSLGSLALIVLTGTPLAWWIATHRGRAPRLAALLVDLPIVTPPAVLGVALLETFGRQGLLGPALAGLGLAVPFTTAAVVIAQVIVAAPFYVKAAANAFRQIDPELWLVARTLGASPPEALRRVALPIALPGLVAGASLAWARALGEFGATLLFAGNLPGTTQTLPLAIYSALETDMRVALAMSLVLCATAVLLLWALSSGPGLMARLSDRPPAKAAESPR